MGQDRLESTPMARSLTHERGSGEFVPRYLEIIADFSAPLLFKKARRASGGQSLTDGINSACGVCMQNYRLILAHPTLAVALLLGACGSSHGLDDGGTAADAASGTDSGATPLDGGATDGGNDAGPGDIDAGPRGTCDAEDARELLCPEVLCDGPPSWHWNGERCVAIDCGTCIGADCGRGGPSQSQCEQAHQSCESSLCISTGGTWLWWAELCGHYQCGRPAPENCEVGRPGCDCGPGGSFIDGVGCGSDYPCPAVDPLPEDELCLTTGGSWNGTCGHSVCGVPSPLDCAQLACTCGPMEVFHPERGCEVGQQCMERSAGESCQVDSRCEGGTICCDDCGGAGCAGNPTCRFPLCDGYPNRDMCGNNVLAP